MSPFLPFFLYRGSPKPKVEKKEKCQFLLYVGRCKGKTDICQFFSFFSMNLSLMCMINQKDSNGKNGRRCHSPSPCAVDSISPSAVGARGQVQVELDPVAPFLASVVRGHGK